MITKSEARKYKKIIGTNYANRILDYFDGEEIKRESGEKFTVQDIHNTMNGRQYSTLEKHIIAAVEHCLKENMELDRKKQLLKTA